MGRLILKTRSISRCNNAAKRIVGAMGCNPTQNRSILRQNEAGGRILNNRQLHAALDDARADRVTGEAGGVVDVELFHQMLAMLLDGLDADAKFAGGLFVGLALGDELEHFHLARGELCDFLFQPAEPTGCLLLVMGEAFGDGGTEINISFATSRMALGKIWAAVCLIR